MDLKFTQTYTIECNSSVIAELPQQIIAHIDRVYHEAYTCESRKNGFILKPKFPRSPFERGDFWPAMSVRFDPETQTLHITGELGKWNIFHILSVLLSLLEIKLLLDHTTTPAPYLLPIIFLAFVYFLIHRTTANAYEKLVHIIRLHCER